MAYMYYIQHNQNTLMKQNTKQKKCQQNTATKVKRVYHFVNKLSFIFKWLL